VTIPSDPEVADAVNVLKAFFAGEPVPATATLNATTGTTHPTISSHKIVAQSFFEGMRVALMTHMDAPKMQPSAGAPSASSSTPPASTAESIATTQAKVAEMHRATIAAAQAAPPAAKPA